MTTSGHQRVRPRIARRLAVAAAGVLLTASCAAGQHAETADVQPAIDGTHGKLGALVFDGVAIHAPTGASYPAGSNAQLAMTVVNTDSSADTLVNVTSPAFTGWSIVDNADAASTSEQSTGDTGLTIEANGAERLGLADLGASADLSPRTLILRNLTDKDGLFPGTTVPVTFRFANAGSTTLIVPVQLSATPNNATLPVPSGTPAE